MKIDQIENKDSNYYKFRKEALSWIEKISGDEWTDYNAHDPGITLLEAFCYILTEIEYKTKFSMEDILYSSSIPTSEILTANALYPAELIFPTSPVTSEDFRMKILDELKGVRNVWIINNSKNNKLKSEIIIELSHNAQKEQEQERVTNFVKRHKILGLEIDVDNITFLKSEKYKLHGQLYIEPQASPEKTFAQLLYLFNEKLVNVEPTSYSLSNLMNKGEPLEEIFEGPFMEQGFILDKDLQAYHEVLDLNEIKHHLIESKWVENFTHFGISRENEQKIVDPHFKIKNELPFLAPNMLHPVKVYQEAKLIELNKEEVFYQYGKITQNLKRQYHLNNDSETFSFSEHVKKRNISKFHRLLEDLPTLYKITDKNELHSNYSTAKDLDNTQLKNFILPLEQFMANVMKSIEEFGKYYQVKSPSVYYNQQPLKNSEVKLSYATVHKIDFLKKRNQVLDHLLSRFNIQLDYKIHDLFYGKLRRSLQQQLNCKELFLQYLPELTSATAYTSHQFKEQISFLELEILLRLWIDKLPQKPFYKSLDKFEISIYQLNEDAQVIGQNYLRDYYDQAPYWEEYWFYVKDEKPLENILKSGIDKTNYTIEKNTGHHEYSVCLQTGETNYKNIIYRTHRKQKAYRAIKLAVRKFYQINQRSEGFYLLDHSRIANKRLYSLHTVSFIFPAWSIRFQSVAFQKKTEKLICDCLPAHLKINFVWLDYEAMKFFEMESLIYEKSASEEINFSEEIVQFLSTRIDEQR